MSGRGSVDGLRNALVDRLVAAGVLRDGRVAQAFGSVPRHLFLPGVAAERAYRDEAVPTKWDSDGRPVSSSSQPAVMAMMLEQLDVRPGQRVLEIGAGTGYNAALLAALVGASGEVTTVDLDEDLVEQTRSNLAAAGVDGVRVVCADGAGGWPDRAPYDRIILTAGAWDLAPAWTEQLAAGGRLLLPLSLRGVQRSVAFEPAGDHLASVSVLPCGFMPLRGAMAGPETSRPLGPEPGLFLELDAERGLDVRALYAALGQPGDLVATGVRVTAGEVFDGLALSLALHEPDAGRLSAVGPVVDRVWCRPCSPSPAWPPPECSSGSGSWRRWSASASSPSNSPTKTRTTRTGPARSSSACTPLVPAAASSHSASWMPSAAGTPADAQPPPECASGPTPQAASSRTTTLLSWTNSTPGSCSTGRSTRDPTPP